MIEDGYTIRKPPTRPDNLQPELSGTRPADPRAPTEPSCTRAVLNRTVRTVFSLWLPQTIPLRAFSCPNKSLNPPNPSTGWLKSHQKVVRKVWTIYQKLIRTVPYSKTKSCHLELGLRLFLRHTTELEACSRCFFGYLCLLDPYCLMIDHATHRVSSRFYF